MVRRRLVQAARWSLCAALFAALPALVIPATLLADDKPGSDEVEFFEKKIRPVLVEHCYKCHSSEAEKLEAGLFLDTRDGAQKGGDSGPAVVPGDPNASLLIQAIRYESFEMPPTAKLPPEVIADFERWVKIGAPDPREGSGSPQPPALTVDIEKGKEFWSFQPPQPHALPEVSEPSWLKRKIDGFILAKLDQVVGTLRVPFSADGTRSVPTTLADRRTFIRRVTLDLTGLPPTPEAVEAFLADKSPDAAERLVDRLLASPHFGERVARTWLDLARYAEDQAHIVGKDDSLFYPNAYLYRDWVIAALNGDMPYDDFLRLQLAADLIEGDQTPNLPALGLLGLGPKYYGRRSLQVMSDEWEDRVDVVGRGLLGLTVACARCHDHKFDPIGTDDYYALAGVFASTSMFNRPLHEGVETKDSKKEDDDKDFENGKKLVGEAKKPADAMHIVREGDVQDLNVLIRGNANNKGPVAPRRFLRVLCESDPPLFTSGSGRRELAEEIASPDNPLTARVIVNRIWGLYFGRPLVSTPSNFGKMGEPPTHPELLDDLAVRFVDNGWSLKWLVREIVLSATYAQSSDANPALLAADPDNRLLGRMPRRRLSVEQWRDSVLAAAGRLQPAVGGPSIDPQDAGERRRTIYSRASRLELNKLLAMFDYPDPNVHADSRVETTTPLQKMFVMNSQFMAAQAESLAARLHEEVPTGASLEEANRERIERAYSVLYGRQPSGEELRLGVEFLAGDQVVGTLRVPSADDAAGPVAESTPDGTRSVPTTDEDGTRSVPTTSERWKQYAHVLLAANELLYVD